MALPRLRASAIQVCDKSTLSGTRKNHQEKIVFIGLGTMGLDMARNVIEKGHTVVGYDLSEQAMKIHLSNGGSTAESPADAANGAQIVITMLPNGAVVRKAIFDADGIIKTMSSKSLLIDMSTIDPLETDAIRNELSAKGIAMVDAPVGRTSIQARTGNSMFMVGAQKQHLETARPILECMGESIVDCG